MHLTALDIEHAMDDQIPKPELAVTVRRGRGRPPTITLPVIREVAEKIAKGMTEEQACTLVGVNHSSFRTARSRHPEFEAAVKEAQAAYLDTSLDMIGKGARGWQGRAWILERRHGDQFRRNTGVEISGHLASFNPIDALLKKPLVHWTEIDIGHSVGAWRLLRQWSNEQLGELVDAYSRWWGPDMRRWTDEQLDWRSAVDAAMEMRHISNSSSGCDGEIGLLRIQ